MASFWDKLRSGWGVAWHVKVEGLPIIWAERLLTGLTMPTGYTATADLVIDRSADIGSLADRHTGIGAGLPLTFRLRDSATARTWCRSPGVEVGLVVALGSGAAATITVTDASGFTAPGHVWIGTEAIAFTGTGTTTLTGCTRGQYGSRATPHKVGSVGSIVSDRPRHWRGRLVTLAAVLVTPDGELDSAGAFEDLAKICWRGWVDVGPRRRSGGFEIEALALDRLLDRPLAAFGSGMVEGTDGKFPVDPGFHFRMWLELYNNVAAKVHEYDILCEPFASVAAGTLYTTAQAHEAIQAAWAASVAASVDQVGGGAASVHFLTKLEIYKVVNNYYKADNAGPGYVDFKVGTWAVGCKLHADAAVVHTKHWVLVGQVQTIPYAQIGEGLHAFPYPSMPEAYYLPWQWIHGGNPTQPSMDAKPVQSSGLTVTLDDPTLTPPAVGGLVIDGKVYAYSSYAQTGADLYFQGLSAPASVVGKRCDIVSSKTGTYADLIRMMLTSGDGPGWSSYDVLGQGQGYSLPASGDRWASWVDEASVAAIASGPLATLQAQLRGHGGRSLADVFGGALILGQRALVLREEGPEVDAACRLGLVVTDPGGSGWTDAIGDTDLVSIDGDPVQVLEEREVATAVKATFLGVGADDGLIVTTIDGPELAAVGGTTIEASLPSVPGVPAEAALAIGAWAASLLKSSRTTLAFDVLLAPWRDVRLGGVVAISLRHPDLWDPAGGTPTATGYARVLGLRRNPGTCAQTATLLLGTSDVGDLCPSIPVASWTGGAGAPVIIVVSVVAASVLAACEAKGGSPVLLWHTRPGCGAEASGGTVSVTVDLYGGFPTGTLFVSASALTQNLDSTSELTFPDDSSGNAWQAPWMHVDTGQHWA